MVRAELVREKARRLSETMAALGRVLPETSAALATDGDIRDLVAFRVYLVVQECIDLAAHVIADEGWGPAPSLREHFEILARRGLLDAATAGELAAAVKVRNLVAHAYVAVDPAKLHAAALEIPLPAERLRKALLRYADETGAPPP